MTNFYRNIFRLVRKSNLIKFDQVWSSLIKFDQVWSSLIKFDQVWSSLDRSDLKKPKNKTVIFILSVNVTTFYSNIFRLVRNPIWSSLIKFDPFWTDLIQKKSKNKTAIFILFKNVTTLFTNIFWYVQPLKSFFFGQTEPTNHGNRTDIEAQIVV